MWMFSLEIYEKFPTAIPRNKQNMFFAILLSFLITCFANFIIKNCRAQYRQWHIQSLIKDLKLVSTNFIKFLFFHQMIALQKLWKLFFISSKKLFSFSRYLNFCSFSPFHNSQIQKDKWKRNDLWCHELACINLQM